MIVYLFWLLLGAVGALAFGFGARRMVDRRHEAELASYQAMVFAALVAQHLIFVYLAARLILDVPGPSGVLLLTIGQVLVTPASCALAARLLGLIGHEKEDRSMATDAKPWYYSKTIWTNTVSLVMALAAYFAGPELGLPPEVAHAAGVVLGAANVVNLWLRTATNQPIQGTPADVPPRLRGRLE